MTELYLPVAIVIVAALAWDVARRAIAPRKVVDDSRVAALEANTQDLNTCVLKTDKAMAELGIDWLKKFAELEAQMATLDKQLTTKVGGAIANLPSRGYNR